MEAPKAIEQYPVWIVLLSSLVSLLIYGLGVLIVFQLSWIFAILFLLYILVLEYRLIRYHCVDCYYWGKRCAFGKGYLSALFFKKGDTARFCAREFSWKDMIPDLMVSLVPLVTGVVLLVINFNIGLLIGLVVLVLLSTMGNGFIRGSLACKNCKQRELGCLAEQLFNQGK